MSSPNKQAATLFDDLVTRKDSLRINVHELAGGKLIDAGCKCTGSIEAGLIVGRICMGGLSDIQLVTSPDQSPWPSHIQVSTSIPTLSCLGCQYAGWNLYVEDGDTTYRAMASGPGRLQCAKETLIKELGYADSSDTAVFVLESDQLPPESVMHKVAADCGLPVSAIHLIVTPTGSLAGCVQIASRIVEVALHQAHELKFPIEKIIEGMGSTPLPPPVDDFMTAMGRTNDTMLYGGRVHLIVDCDAQSAETLATKLPSNRSRDYGKPFAELFKQYNYDFFAVDPALFSPAIVTITSLASGQSFTAGQFNQQLLHDSFGLSE